MKTARIERIDKEQVVPYGNPFILKATRDMVLYAGFPIYIDLGIKIHFPENHFPLLIGTKIHPNLDIINTLSDDCGLVVLINVYKASKVEVKKGDDIVKIFIRSCNIEAYRFLEIIDGKIIRFGDSKNILKENPNG